MPMLVKNMPLKTISLCKRFGANGTGKLSTQTSSAVVFHVTYHVASIFETILTHGTVVVWNIHN